MTQITPVVESVWGRFTEFLTEHGVIPELGFQPQGVERTRDTTGFIKPTAYLVVGQADPTRYYRTIGDKNIDQLQTLDFAVLVAAADYITLLRAIDVVRAALIDFEPEQAGRIDAFGGSSARLPVDNFLTPYTYTQMLGFVCSIGLEVSS